VATFAIFDVSAPYYTIQVAFGPLEFVQTIISTNTGNALTTQLQSYADAYETDWLALDVPAPAGGGGT
jgi:hypothetical protein